MRDIGIGGKQCGIDEAGRGPVLGPMVMTIVCGDTDKIRNTGAKDSKTMSRSARNIAYEKIMKTADAVEYIIIDSLKINEMMEHMTLNEIEFIYAIELLNHAKAPCIVDSFDVLEERCTMKLSEGSGKDVMCKHRADSIYPAVSAASVVSKVIRDGEMDRISKRFAGIGSGYPSDPRTIEFLRRSIKDKIDISSIVRTHWETYKKIFAETAQEKLY